jgi:hypothetical protein
MFRCGRETLHVVLNSGLNNQNVGSISYSHILRVRSFQKILQRFAAPLLHESLNQSPHSLSPLTTLPRFPILLDISTLLYTAYFAKYQYVGTTHRYSDRAICLHTSYNIYFGNPIDVRHISHITSHISLTNII